MAATTADIQDSIIPMARSVTPGPLLFRSPQSHRISSGRISRRRRSTSLSLRDLNRAAIYEEALLRQSQHIPLPTSLPPVTGFSIEAAPSLISSASSTPSTVAFDVFPCSEAGSLPTTLPSLLSDSPLLGFEYVVAASARQYEVLNHTNLFTRPHMDFAVPLQYNPIAYSSSYQPSKLLCFKQCIVASSNFK
jgi:hypothetical protein